MIYDDLTILMFRNIIKNDNYSLPSKSVTTAPKIGTSYTIPDIMMIYDDLSKMKNNSYTVLSKV